VSWSTECSIRYFIANLLGLVRRRPAPSPR
jgi:hypothetical protein